jgi:uncharacterized protein (TIGR02118 family)
MLKFAVVVTRRSDLSVSAFVHYFRAVHGPLAKKLPGLRAYTQNFPSPDPNRKRPDWDAVIELYFDDYESVQSAWESVEGRAATDDLGNCADLQRTTWSVVEEVRVMS